VRLAPVTVLLLAGCRAVDPAPTDIDGVMHAWWTGYDDPNEARATAVVNAHAVTGIASIAPPEDGTLSDLAPADLELVGLGDRDPGLASGMFLLNRFPCDLDVLERTLIALNQDELYGGAYDAYARTYTSDADAWLSGDTERLTWDISLTSSYVGSTFDETLRGEIRRVPSLDDEATPFGPVLFQRTWMPTPAVFASGSNRFEQDYQIEVYYQVAPGEIAHQYAIWREIEVAGLDNDSEILVGITLNNLAKFDEGTAAICADGGP
jgi:hypothetical protein